MAFDTPRKGCGLSVRQETSDPEFTRLAIWPIRSFMAACPLRLLYRGAFSREKRPPRLSFMPMSGLAGTPGRRVDCWPARCPDHPDGCDSWPRPDNHPSRRRPRRSQRRRQASLVRTAAILDRLADYPVASGRAVALLELLDSRSADEHRLVITCQHAN